LIRSWCFEEALKSHVQLVVPDMTSHFGGLVTDQARQAFESTGETFEGGIVKFQFVLHNQEQVFESAILGRQRVIRLIWQGKAIGDSW